MYFVIRIKYVRWWLRCRLSNREVLYAYRVLLPLLLVLPCVLLYCCVAAAAAAVRRWCSVCCYAAVVAAAAAVQLLPAVVVILCRMAKFCGFIESDPSSFKRDLVLMHPLAVLLLSHVRPRFAYILGNYGHARSQGGRHPATAKASLALLRVILESWQKQALNRCSPDW